MLSLIDPCGSKCHYVPPLASPEAPQRPLGTSKTLLWPAETKEEIMSRLHIRLGTWTITLCMFFVLTGISAMAKPQTTTTDDQTAATATTKKKKKKATTTTDTAARPIGRHRYFDGHPSHEVEEEQESSGRCCGDWHRYLNGIR